VIFTSSVAVQLFLLTVHVNLVIPLGKLDIGLSFCKLLLMITLVFEQVHTPVPCCGNKTNGSLAPKLVLLPHKLPSKPAIAVTVSLVILCVAIAVQLPLVMVHVKSLIFGSNLLIVTKVTVLLLNTPLPVVLHKPLSPGFKLLAVNCNKLPQKSPTTLLVIVGVARLLLVTVMVLLALHVFNLTVQVNCVGPLGKLLIVVLSVNELFINTLLFKLLHVPVPW